MWVLCACVSVLLDVYVDMWACVPVWKPQDNFPWCPPGTSHPFIYLLLRTNFLLAWNWSNSGADWPVRSKNFPVFSLMCVAPCLFAFCFLFSFFKWDLGIWTQVITSLKKHFLFNFILYVWLFCLHVYMCIMCRGQRKERISCNWSYRWL